MLLFRMSDRALGLVSTFILVRLLTPADFGLVAMAMSVIALIELASAFGLDVPLIQRADVTRDHYDTAWTLNLLFSLACAAATAALAYPTAGFYGEPRLTPVMLTLAAGWAVQGFSNIGVVNFRRSMQFHREAGFLICRRLAGFVVGLACAVFFRSYWALVAGIMTTRLTGVALSYLMEPYRPRLTLRARADLFSISGWLFLNNILHFGIARVSHFLVGRMYGARSLGLYSIGAEFAYLPQTELIAPVNRAVFPGYARMANNLDQMRSGFVEINAFIVALAVPASVGIAVVAEPFVYVLLGPQWADAIPVLQILAFAGAATALMSNSYSAYLAVGRPYVPTLLLTIELLVLVPGMMVLPRLYGVPGIAAAELLSATVGACCSYPILFRTLKISLWHYASHLWRPLIAGTFMGLSVDRLLESIGNRIPPAGLLVIGIFAGIAIYGCSLLLLWLVSGRPKGAEHHLLSFLQSRLPAPLRATAGQ